MRKSTLLTGMAAAAGKPQPGLQVAPPAAERRASNGTGETVMIGAHYPSEVRRALKFLEADTGRKLKPLLAEAINDLCAKYGRAQPCTVED